jgi:hypothetical protein
MSAVVNPQMKPPGSWFDYVYNTGNELKKRGLPDNNYDRAHSPQPINKQEFIEVMGQWDMVKHHYTISNIYNNSSKVFKGENIRGRNLKVYGTATPEQLDKLSENKICMNYSDPSLDENMKEWLSRRFPEPSEFEVFITPQSRRQAVENWFKSGCNYDEGAFIFQHFAPKNGRLIKFFRLRRGTELGNIMLKKTLRLWMR